MVRRFGARRALAAGIAAVIFVLVVDGSTARAQEQEPQPYGATPRPVACQPGDQPETGLQGQVSAADRASGRSTQGYRCNLSLVGQSQGQGTSWVNQRYGHCAYVGQSLVGNVLSPDRGVRVLDVSDPTSPTLTDLLTSPAMVGDTWESLRVNQERGLLAAVAVGPVVGVAFFDIYDIATDCEHPRLLNSIAGTDLSIPANVIGHEGGFSPDGRTYWSSGVVAGSVTAIDVSDPTLPRAVWTGVTGVGGHGFDISPDGNRMYLTSLSGFTTFDISQVQSRAPLPTVSAIGVATWPGTIAPQHTISITHRGAPWIIAVDEIGQDGIHFIDNTDAAHPVVHPGISLEVERPEHAAAVTADTGSDALGLFGYSPHYCSVDRIDEPTALACGYFQSGVRVFDIRDLAHPREIAYFNPPAQTARKAQLLGSWHATLGDLTADWCTSPPAFVGDQLWVTCQDNGFMVLELAPGTYPLTAATPTAPVAPSPTVSPSMPPGPSEGGATLPATGGSSDRLLVGLGLLGAALALRVLATGDGRIPAGSIVAVAVVVAIATVGTTAVLHEDVGDDVGRHFAAAMIDHHDEAIAMARAVLDDPRTTPTNRALAAQIEAQQTNEVAILEGWLQGEGEPVAHRTDHAAHAAQMVTDGAAGAAELNDGFLAMMAAHHRTAIPMATAALDVDDPHLARLAATMLADQTVESVALDRLRAGAGTNRSAFLGQPYVCELPAV